MRNLLVITLIGMLLAGCISAPAAENAQEETVSTNAAGTPGNMDMPSSTSGMDKYVGLAKQDLAGRLKIDAAKITLQKTMEITWPDIRRGCTPGVGQILTKGQVYGYRVWLKAGDKVYIFHVGLNDQVILCPDLDPGANNPLLKTPGKTGQDSQNQIP